MSSRRANVKKPILCMLVLALNAGAVQALEKDEVLVVYNRNFIASGDMRKRNIPKGNILALDTVTVEGMSRDRFVKGIQIPVERWLSSHKANAKIRCIVLMRGVPLKVDRVVDPEKQKAYRKADREVRTIEKSKKALEARKKHLEEQAGSDPERARASRKAVEEINTRLTHLIVKLAEAGPRRDAAKKENDEFSKNTNASVDSELSVMFCRNNPIRKWLPNLLFYKAWVVPNRERYPKVFMVCRLDGPSDDAVKRIIDDSVAVEVESARPGVVPR